MNSGQSAPCSSEMLAERTMCVLVPMARCSLTNRCLRFGSYRSVKYEPIEEVENPEESMATVPRSSISLRTSPLRSIRSVSRPLACGRLKKRDGTE